MRERGSASSPGMGEAATRRKVALPLLCCRKHSPSPRPLPHFSGPLNPTRGSRTAPPSPSKGKQEDPGGGGGKPYSGMDEPAHSLPEAALSLVAPPASRSRTQFRRCSGRSGAPRGAQGGGVRGSPGDSSSEEYEEGERRGPPPPSGPGPRTSSSCSQQGPPPPSSPATPAGSPPSSSGGGSSPCSAGGSRRKAGSSRRDTL